MATPTRPNGHLSYVAAVVFLFPIVYWLLQERAWMAGDQYLNQLFAQSETGLAAGRQLFFRLLVGGLSIYFVHMFFQTVAELPKTKIASFFLGLVAIFLCLSISGHFMGALAPIREIFLDFVDAGLILSTIASTIALTRLEKNAFIPGFETFSFGEQWKDGSADKEADKMKEREERLMSDKKYLELKRENDELKALTAGLETQSRQLVREELAMKALKEATAKSKKATS